MALRRGTRDDQKVTASPTSPVGVTVSNTPVSSRICHVLVPGAVHKVAVVLGMTTVCRLPDVSTPTAWRGRIVAGIGICVVASVQFNDVCVNK